MTSLDMESHSCFKPHLRFVDPFSQGTATFRMHNTASEQAERSPSSTVQAPPPPPPGASVTWFLRNGGEGCIVVGLGEVFTEKDTTFCFK